MKERVTTKKPARLAAVALLAVILAFGGLATSAAAENGTATAPAPVRTEYVRQIVYEAQRFAIDPRQEYKLGKEAADEVKRQVTLVNDDPRRQKIIQMVNLLKAYSPRPKVKYEVNIVKSKEVNAFSIPGGFLFFYTGLLDYVKSDDELAGVVAHEMAHNCLYHALRAMKKAQKTQQMVTWAQVAMVLAGGNVNPADVMLAGNLVLTGIMNGYSQEFEFQADALGTDILARCPRFQPAGLMEFSERIAHDETLEAHNFEPGILQTHPDMPARVQAMYKELRDMGITPKLRAVYNPLEATVRPLIKAGHHVAAVVVGDKEVYTTYVRDPEATEMNASDPEQCMKRAQDIAARLNKALVDYDLQLGDLSVKHKGDTWAVYAVNMPLVQVRPEEAQLADTTPKQLAERVLQELQTLLWEERLSKVY